MRRRAPTFSGPVIARAATPSVAAAPATARDLLIALHLDRRLPLGRRRRLAAAIVRRAGASRPPSAIAVALLEPLLPAVAAETAAAARLGARLITRADAEFPPALARLASEPWVLYIRGNFPDLPAVAIVGSRHADLYGRETAHRFAQRLAASGIAVVSGLAHGVDAAAHAGALAAGGVTVAVLGCGLAVDYPRGHADLAEAIAQRGAVISQFACDAPPRRWQFDRRARTLAACCALTLVVQATPRSGALLTAAHAHALGRTVCAIPGPVGTPLSWGPHWLLRQGGAELICDPGEVLDLLPPMDPCAGPAEGDRRSGRTHRTHRRHGQLAGGGDPVVLSALPAAGPHG